jgi:hyperosmotically inducible protein
VVDAVDVLDRIRTDFVRHELLDHATITVDVHGTTVTLTGTVGSRAERDEAERIALATTGVDAVHNLLQALHDEPHERYRR